MAFDRDSAVVIAAAFVPALITLAIVRRSARAGMGVGFFVCLFAFGYGALFAILFAILLNPIATAFFHGLLPAYSAQFVAIVIAAPVAEEFVKAYGVRIFRGAIGAPVDGIVLGAACALGFSATENLAYGASTLAASGTTAWLAIAIARSISSSLVHPSATGITGYGIARTHLRGHSWLAVVPYYLLAVGLHATFNYTAEFMAPIQIGDASLSLNFLAAIVLAWLAFRGLRTAVRRG